VQPPPDVLVLVLDAVVLPPVAELPFVELDAPPP
jgi:hypothetical protein